MAITIQATPAANSSIQGDLIYTVAEVVKTADPATYPNYKFIGDVYVGGTMVARLRKVPDPTTRIGVFNIGQIVRNYIAATFDPTASAIRSQQLGDGVFWLDITMKFGEEYSYTTYTNLTVDSARKFFNHYNGRQVGTTTILSNTAFQTNRPTTTSVLSSASNLFLAYMNSNVSAFKVRLKTYAGTLLAFNGTQTITPATAYDLQILNVSPVNLASVYSTSFAAITHYTIEIEDSPTPVTAVYRFDLVCEAVYETYTLHFLNKYGGFDSVEMRKVSRKTIDIEKQSFGKLGYTIDSSGVVTYKNANGVYNENRSVYSSQYQEKLTLNSDLLTDAEYSWLADLILSPMVYIQDGLYYFPCVITQNNYDFKKAVNDELSNLTISIEYGQTLNAQYR